MNDGQLGKSYNYLYYVYDTVNVSLEAAGLEGLTEEGRRLYTERYEHFGVECGDNYIT